MTVHLTERAMRRMKSENIEMCSSMIFLIKDFTEEFLKIVLVRVKMIWETKFNH